MKELEDASERGEGVRESRRGIQNLTWAIPGKRVVRENVIVNHVGSRNDSCGLGVVRGMVILRKW